MKLPSSIPRTHINPPDFCDWNSAPGEYASQEQTATQVWISGKTDVNIAENAVMLSLVLDKQPKRLRIYGNHSVCVIDA